MHGELRVVNDVASAFAAEVQSAYDSRTGELFSIALSGGSTARGCYEHLAATAADSIDWFSVDVYWGDERCVPPEHPDSNERLGREALLTRVGGAHAVYPMRCDEGADAYQLKLVEAGKLDVVHLGLGSDAHTASLFPSSPALDADPDRLVAMNHDPSGRAEHDRMTLTLAGIARCHTVIVTVAGQEKRAALESIVAGGDVPGAHVRGARVIWLVDPAAAPAS
ncbi:MAG: 6-phosphogluconolactonase [Acidimicrobiales bacterium]